MERGQRKYDHEYKVQAVKLAREIGGVKAAKELAVPEGTIHTWLKAAISGSMDIGEGPHTPESAMSLAEERAILREKSMLKIPATIPISTYLAFLIASIQVFLVWQWRQT